MLAGFYWPLFVFSFLCFALLCFFICRSTIVSLFLVYNKEKSIFRFPLAWKLGTFNLTYQRQKPRQGWNPRGTLIRYRCVPRNSGASAHAKRGVRSAAPWLIENRNLMPENLLMTSAFTVRLLVKTLGVEVKKPHLGREGSPRHILCLSFWRKINHFRGNKTEVLE